MLPQLKLMTTNFCKKKKNYEVKISIFKIGDQKGRFMKLGVKSEF